MEHVLGAVDVGVDRVAGHLQDALDAHHLIDWDVVGNQVADLMQKGRCQQARELALAIPVDHLRGLALLLVNYSRKL